MFGNLFSKTNKLDRFDQLATNMYETLVTEPPSSDDPDAFGPIELEINSTQLVQFSEKRIFLLEAMFFCAAITASNGQATPLSASVTKLLDAKWRERGIRPEIIDSMSDVYWIEIEAFLNGAVPVTWAKQWLGGFYPEEDYCPHLYTWRRQCTQEFDAMLSMFKENELHQT